MHSSLTVAFSSTPERLYGGDRQRQQTECNKLEERGRWAQLFSTFFSRGLAFSVPRLALRVARVHLFLPGAAWLSVKRSPDRSKKKKKRNRFCASAIIRIVMGYRIITCRLSDGSVVDRVSRDRGNLNCFPAAIFFPVVSNATSYAWLRENRRD